MNVTTVAPPTKAEVEAQLLTLVALAQHMQHHEDNTRGSGSV